MNFLTRRLAAVALGGALAVGSLSGCGMFGTALDCGQLASSANDVTGNINDPAALQTALDDFRAAGEKVDDAELKDAVTTFADEAQAFSDYSEKVKSDPATAGDPPDDKKLMDAADTITKKCSG